jgi:small subunit ribosomal protein S8e
MPIETRLGETERKTVKARGGGVKEKLEYTNKANVRIGDKHVVCEVTWLKDNPASRDYTRRNVITRGAVIDVKTPEGEVIQARVTSRPGQDGVLNAVKV